ncbi:MAG: hypothetical protein VX777_07740 [Chlamydiota bacterium]|nr:hypothetical protein [Chlamydiota bacterium]
MRNFFSILLLSGTLIGGIWLFNNNPDLASTITQYIENGDFLTLEARYSPEDIMQAHRHELLVDDYHSYQEPSLKFHPYLLIEAKYTGKGQRTREGIILWSLVDGEMVLDTDTWSKTHGFQDALLVNATRNEFKILNVLAKYGGATSKEKLKKELNLEPEIFEPWIDSARGKHLIIQKGNHLFLHFQNPNILVTPQTKISQWLVTKPYNHAQRIPKRFSRKQVEKISKAAFGSNFTIRSMKEVALPVYSVEVLNPDGSLHTSFWNALNGQRINPRTLAY